MDDLGRSGVAVAPETRDFLEIIDKEVVRCKQIVDGLLDFSRPKQPRRERADLNEVIQRTLFLLKHHVRFKKLAVQTELDPLLRKIQRKRLIRTAAFRQRDRLALRVLEHHTGARFEGVRTDIAWGPVFSRDPSLLVWGMS